MATSRAERAFWVLVVLASPAALSSPATAACDATAYEAVSDSFQAGLDALREREGLPGAVAAFSAADCPIAVAAAGFADVERRTPMQPDAKFMAGSIGKSFVAALALDLVHDGQLSLDEKIEQRLGTAAWFDRLPNAHDITLRMLLNHGSGVPDHVFTTRFLVVALRKRFFGDSQTPFSPQELVEIVLDRPPLFPAGRGYGYTDTGYILVGLIIEQSTGRTFYEIVGERILGPLELTLTLPGDRLEIPGLASGYHRRISPLPSKVSDAGVFVFHPKSEWTGGGLATNPRDLVAWARALYEGRAFDWQYLELLHSSPNPFRGELAIAYGIGFFVYATRLGTAYGHSGWFPGYTGSMLYFPAAHLAVAFQTNTDRAGEPRDYLIELAELAMPLAAVQRDGAANVSQPRIRRRQ